MYNEKHVCVPVCEVLYIGYTVIKRLHVVLGSNSSIAAVETSVSHTNSDSHTQNTKPVYKPP